MKEYIAGSILGLRNLVTAAAYAALLFAEYIPELIPLVMNAMLLGTSLSCFFLAIRSSFKGSIASPQDGPAILLSVAVAVIFSKSGLGLTHIQEISLSLALIFTGSFLTALCFLLIGAKRLGRLVRFIPYPVIGGFLAGSGYLFLIGGHKLLTKVDQSVSPDTILPGTLQFSYLPAVLMGFILFYLLKKGSGFLTLPLCILITAGAVHLQLYAYGLSIEDAQNYGILVQLPRGQGFEFAMLSGFEKEFPLSYFIGELLNLFALVIVGIISLAMSVAGIELVASTDLDLDNEFKIMGQSNLISSFFFSTPHYHSLAATSLSYDMGNAGRKIGIITAIAGIIGIFIGKYVLLILPQAVIVGLLFFMGLSLLHTWLVMSVKQLPLVEYLIIVAIVIVVAFMSYIEGILLGFLLSSLTFVFRYSRIEAIRFSATGKEMSSNVARAPRVKDHLKTFGETLLLMRLDGFIFFGSANQIYKNCSDRVQDESKLSLKYLVIDFKSVTGLDASAMNSFQKVLKLCEKFRINLFFSNAGNDILQLFKRYDITDQAHEYLRYMPDMDRALEQCENHSLQDHEELANEGSEPFEEYLVSQEVEPVLAKIIYQRFELIEFDAQENLVRQGDPGDSLFYLAEGRIQIVLELPNGRSLRLLSVRPGALVGEMGIYSHEKRSATMLCETNCRIYKLSDEAMIDLETNEPAAAAAFHRIIVKQMSERFRTTQGLLQKALN